LKATTHAIEWWTKQFPERTPDHWLVYLMTLLDESPAPIVETILTRLTLPTRESAKVRAAKRRVPSVLRALATSQRVRPSRAYRLLADLSDESLILLAAKAGSKDIQDLITAHVTTYQHVKPSLTGADLKALGLKPGPLYKKILDRLRDARLNGTVTTEADERALVKRLAKLQERQS
jgi:tRNA nucleotidyltransferase (CCA-adding enzyme)